MSPEVTTCEDCLLRLSYSYASANPDELIAFIYEDIPDVMPGVVREYLGCALKISNGLEKSVYDCPGSQPSTKLAELIDRLVGSEPGQIDERHCNNPYLQTTEYAQNQPKVTQDYLRQPQTLEQAIQRASQAVAIYESYFANKKHPNLSKLMAAIADRVGLLDEHSEEMRCRRELSYARQGLAKFVAPN